MELGEWISYCQEVIDKLRVSKDHILKLSKQERAKLSQATEELREKFIYCILSEDQIEEAKLWIDKLLSKIEDLKKSAGIKGVTFAKELRSFLEDPLLHLKKKIFVYTFDLLSGNLRIADYIMKAGAAIRTSLRTNMRSIYQTWVFLVLIDQLVKDHGRIVYPEHGYIYVERNRRQTLGMLLPNCIVEFNHGKRLSFFIEVPRPLSWEDSSDLAKVWKFYVALRPDFMVYSGTEMNIAMPERTPPVKRPNVIIECKELEDWYKRTRDLRGWWTKAISAEHWRLLWLRGLWQGLAEAMGIKTKEELIKTITEERKGLRVKEYRLVQIYKKFYNPDVMLLITRTALPKEIKEDIEKAGLVTFDDIGFNEDRLTEAVDLLKKFGRKEVSQRTITDLIREKYNLGEIDDQLIEQAIMRLIDRHLNEFLSELKQS